MTAGEVGEGAFDVLVNVGPFDGAPTSLIDQAVRLTLGELSVAGGEVSVTLLDDSDVREMNREYLSKDRPTDVIAFSLNEDGPLLGDVYIGFEQAQRQAGELGIPLDQELARLAIHGTLHVGGYDHPEGPERTDSPMFEVQERLLKRLLSPTTKG